MVLEGARASLRRLLLASALPPSGAGRFGGTADIEQEIGQTNKTKQRNASAQLWPQDSQRKVIRGAGAVRSEVSMLLFDMSGSTLYANTAGDRTESCHPDGHKRAFDWSIELYLETKTVTVQQWNSNLNETKR